MINFEELTTEQIRKTLIKASYKYYNQDKSEISDKEYDDLRDELKRRSPEDPYLKTIGAPLPKVSDWKKEKHQIPMGSLDKVNTPEKFYKWIQKISGYTEVFIMQWKLDGISLAVNYENGKLVSGISRGDGTVGENFSKNVIKMINVKEELPIKWNGSLRGEIILTAENFEFINSIKKENDEKPFKNLRNAASGIAKGYDGEFCEYLTVQFYDCTGDFATETEKLFFLQKDLKVATVHYKSCNTEDCEKTFKLFEEMRPTTPWDNDGVVLKLNSIESQNSLGIKEGIPQGQIAWKFESMKVKTKLLNVSREFGLTGVITPVARLEPVRMGGVTVSNASLANYGVFEKFNFKIGDEIIVARAGDVIPKILSNLGGGSDQIDYPQICPVCGEPTVILTNKTVSKGEEKITKKELCSNPECSGKKLGDLKKWCDSIFTENGMSDKTVELLFNKGLIKYPVDYYFLTEKSFKGLPGFAKKKTQKVLKIIEAGKKVSLEKFIDALNIENFGESRAELLIENGYDTIDSFLIMSHNQLTDIKGIGDSIAEAFLTGMEKKLTQIEDLIEVVEIIKKEKEEIIMSSSVFEGKSFLFTGAIQKIEEATGKRYTREKMESLVIKNGGSISKSVNKDLNYLVQADPSSTSTKTQKALSLGIEIMSEENFFKALGM